MNIIDAPIPTNGAVMEGKAAYTLGSDPSANPYRKGRIQFPIGSRDKSDNRRAALRDLECQWDSGYAIAARNSSQSNK